MQKTILKLMATCIFLGVSNFAASAVNETQNKNVPAEAKNGLYVYELPPLPYAFNALEPVISEEIMKLHYTKHHQAYVTNLNKALKEYAEAEKNNDLAQMLVLDQAIKFNGGGHLNHSIFWTNLAPKNQGGGQLQEGELKQALIKEFGSIQNFIDKFSTMLLSIQGSGWGWLGYNKVTGNLIITTSANQDPLWNQGYIPLLGIDMWEHAYYLQYQNVKPDYVKAIWEIINWKNVEERLVAAKKESAAK